ncbi:rho GTPase-activating protein 45 isoform X2 [Hypomesus transpacificus]|uniref:rho GTPase-activating protein 45 isoform X2 n=1 Tax=Hypomesus transpacificus TaxID=137520 RepID=UPI001F072083|nr:rho GTPase-activating protein 45 isoform X2 [Hypomesus transpacificus]
MLKRGGKTSYNPYSTGQRVKKAGSKSNSKLDILPNRPNVLLKQLSILQEMPRRDGVDAALSSSLSSSTLALPSGVSLDPSLSCPGTPSAHHGRMTGVGMASPVSTLKRPTALSRHASAAGFPLQSWVFTKAQAKGATSPSLPAEGPETTAIEVEDIPALLRDVARFAEAVEKLKDVVLLEDKQENRRPLAHVCLGEVLRILRQVINTYPLLNTVEILTAAGKLISKVKGFHYEVSNESEKNDFEKAIETIAVAFSSNVSELLMGEVDSSTLLSQLPTERSRSLENLYAGAGSEGNYFRTDFHNLAMRAEEVDIVLQRSEGGVDSALLYAKTISKYMKDLMTYVERRTSLEVEFGKGLLRLYQSCKHSITQPHMPLYSIYSPALDQDMEQSTGLQQAANLLHNKTFMQPLMQRKYDHEKRRKEIKEQWHRAKRKLMECEANLRKAKHAYTARYEEYQVRAAASRAEEEGGGSTGKSLDKKRRVEEEARNKAEEAEATYRTCVADATTQQQELEHTKVTVLRQLQEVIKQSDQTLRSVTISYYQTMHAQTVALPVHYQTLCESSKQYDPGQQYAAHVKDLQLPEQPEVSYQFEPYSSQHLSRGRHDSFNTDQQSSVESPASTTEPRPSDGTSSEDRKRKGHKSWGSTVSDDSGGGEGGLESPTSSTVDISKMARTSSTGTMSSNEDADEKDGNVASFETPNTNGMEPEMVAPTGPFKNVGLSKAAQTHRMRKLRTPAKCRECDSYVYFQGAECEECFLACHKRCLETLAIQCGHKKLQGKLQLFGRDFSQVAGESSDGIPFIITKCISEIERRALRMKGIYRVNGVKTRVEKLCQAFENGKELVELSQCSPHDISNVLKLYLRQLPEPIIQFRLYHSLMGLAKDSLHTEGEEGPEAEEAGAGLHGAGRGPQLVDLGPDTAPDVLVLVDKLKELLSGLPKNNISTLRYITRHLRRIAELEQDNKMSPSNLGIVFGPSLMRPRPTGATVSLSSLVDYPHQARIVETLIVFYTSIFQSKSSRTSASQSSTSPPQSGAEGESTPDAAVVEEQDGGEELGRMDSDKIDEGCGSSPGSLGSSEQLEDSVWELDESSQKTSLSARPRLVKQESEVSTDDDQLSCRDSLDLSGHSLPLVDQYQDQDQDPEQIQDSDQSQEREGVLDGDPPAPPDTEPPDLEVSEQHLELSVSMAELDMNQSNNNNNCVLGMAGRPLPHLCVGKLPLSRSRDGEAEFV